MLTDNYFSVVEYMIILLIFILSLHITRSRRGVARYSPSYGQKLCGKLSRPSNRVPALASAVAQEAGTVEPASSRSVVNWCENLSYVEK